MAAITVTGGSDGVSSTGTSYFYSFHDGAGKTLLSISFQDGMLMKSDGRYPVEGLSALLGVEGVMLEDEWEEYWEEYSELSDRYRDSFTPNYPETVFAAGGYGTSLLENVDPSEIVSVDIYRDDDAGGRFHSEDAETIARIYAALGDMRVTGRAGDGSGGERFTVSLVVFNPVGFYDYTDFYFKDGCLQGGDDSYAVEGIEAFLAAIY